MPYDPLPDPPDSVDDCGVWHWYCNGPGHEQSTLLARDQFQFAERFVYRTGKSHTYRIKRCRHCLYLTKPGSGGYRYRVHGKVPLSKMQKYLTELEIRAGGVNKAARVVGCSRQAFMIWQGRSTWHERNNPIRNMTRQSALEVLVALRKLRLEQRGQQLSYRPWRGRTRTGHCSGCGTAQVLRSPGCIECTWRHNKWKERGLEYVDHQGAIHSDLLDHDPGGSHRDRG